MPSRVKILNKILVNKEISFIFSFE